MVSATNGLYWGFHSQLRRLSRQKDNGFFSEDLVFNSVYKPHPNFGGYYSQKVRLIHAQIRYLKLGIFSEKLWG
jgi:hypothetical protein